MMRTLFIVFSSLLTIAFLSGCQEIRVKNLGYEIEHGEGSEIYLIRNGEVVFTDVSLIAIKEKNILVEQYTSNEDRFSYDSIKCKYYIIKNDEASAVEFQYWEDYNVVTSNSYSYFMRARS